MVVDQLSNLSVNLLEEAYPPPLLPVPNPVLLDQVVVVQRFTVSAVGPGGLVLPAVHRVRARQAVHITHNALASECTSM